jgi:hypothetical protein
MPPSVAWDGSGDERKISLPPSVLTALRGGCIDASAAGILQG